LQFCGKTTSKTLRRFKTSSLFTTILSDCWNNCGKDASYKPFLLKKISFLPQIQPFHENLVVISLRGFIHNYFFLFTTILEPVAASVEARQSTAAKRGR